MSATEASSKQVDDNRPLTDSELALLQRLLGDPFSFPPSFKTWIVSYLEASDIDLPISAVHGLAAALNLTTALLRREVHVEEHDIGHFRSHLEHLEARVKALEEEH